MEWLQPWLGDLNDLPGLRPEVVGLICITASALGGTIIGLERERRDKPAGLRTLILIALGSTIFTMVSLLLAQKKAMADPARLASQIIPGIGFLGAGAIIHARGIVLGLTTGATIWAVAAVGVTIGSGYVAAGLVFTVAILLTLTAMQGLQTMVAGRCRLGRVAVTYHPDRGKTLPRLREILDRYSVPDSHVDQQDRSTEECIVTCRLCLAHREHRSVLKELAEVREVVALDVGKP